LRLCRAMFSVVLEALPRCAMPKESMDEPEIEPGELKKKLEAKEDFLLLDIREPWEHQAAALAGSKLIPMRQVPEALAELRGEAREIVCYCHHGRRSLDVVLWLQSQGVAARSLAGGIERWSLEVDPGVPRY
jgi:rhodanese-related sulfurtransferase